MEENIKITRSEARERYEDLRREIVTMEWDIEHHGLKLKQGLYDRKRVELEALKKFLEKIT